MKRRAFLKDAARVGAHVAAGTNLINTPSIGKPRHVANGNFLTKLRSDEPMPKIRASYQNVTTTVKLKGREVRMHALCTGTVAVKRNFQTKKGSGQIAKLSILLDKEYTDYLPIWVWVIEHPEGLLVIDTGEVSAIKNLDTYLAKESSFMRFQFKHAAKFAIEQKDELNFQFDGIGLRPEDVKLVVLTHLHLDHTDGLKFFPKQEIIVGETEFNRPNGNMPSTYPTWFKPNLVNYQKDQVEAFDMAYPITRNGDLLYVPTPGHTLGHSSVLFKTDEFDIIFAGDTSYNQGQVLNHELAGVNASFSKSEETYARLMAYASVRKTVYLPTHDEEAGMRLMNLKFLVE